MRFAYAHKLCTYLMVYSAFFALASSGELGELVVMLGFAGIVASWLWEPPRINYDRWSRPWTVLSVLVLAWTIFAAVTGGDLLLLGADFLVYLLVAKLFSRRACRDYQQVYVLTFLMLVAGTVLNTEFTYGLFFLVYVVAATWALILFHLRREMEDNFLLKHSDNQSSERVQVARILNSRRIVGRRFFIGTSLVSLSIFFAASLLFLLIPRIGFGLFFNKNRGGVHMAGFSDGVTLGGHGLIKTDKTVVMRVEVENRYEGRKAPYIHWRGVAFDRYSKGQWRRTRRSPRSRRTVTFWNRKEQHHLLYAFPGLQPSELRGRMESGMRHEIYLEPLGYDVLFGASMPSVFEFESRWGRRRPKSDRNDEIRYQHTVGIKYVVYSDLRRPPVAAMRAADSVVPVGYEVYLQLPEELPERVRRLAKTITSGATNNYDKVDRIQRWLKSNLSYTLEMKSPGDLEPIDFFLFERKKGHCEYFSSALAIMARVVGVPSRNVNGFLGGEWNEYDDYIAVRAGDAHSWVEIYFHGVGWVTFDPTPPAVADRLGRGSGGIRNKLRRFFDTIRFKWFKWVIEYDLHRQMSLLGRIGKRIRGGASGVKQQLGAAKRWMARHRTPLLAIFGSIAAALILLLILRRRSGAVGQVLGRGRRAARDPVAQIYLDVLARLARRGYRRPPARTPREHAAALEKAGAPGARELAELTEIYYAVEWGDSAEPALLARAEVLRDAIDDAFAEARRRQRRPDA